LIVDAPRFVPLRADDLEAAGFDHTVVLFLPLFLRARIGLAAEDDVRATASHVRRYGDAGELSGLRDDAGFLLVLLRVQHLVLDALARQQVGEILRLLDRDRADEHRAPLLAQLFD